MSIRHVRSICVMCFLIGAPTVAGATSVYDELRDAQSIAFLGAHPDDEIFIAPIWADLCLEPGGIVGAARQCHVTMVTTGENGPCLLGSACNTPEKLAAVRAAEQQASTTLLGSRHVGALTNAPLEDQVVPLLRYTDLDPSDPSYLSHCPSLGL